MRTVPLDGHRVRVNGKHTDVHQHGDYCDHQQSGSDKPMAARQRTHPWAESTGRVNRCQRKHARDLYTPYHVTYLAPYPNPISAHGPPAGHNDDDG